LDDFLFASVAIPGLPSLLTYRIPTALFCEAGHQVTVPVGRSIRTGWVTSHGNKSLFENNFKDNPKFDFSKIKDILTSIPVFHPDELKLFAWISEYYSADLATVIETAVPSAPKKISIPEKKTFPPSQKKNKSLPLTPSQENAFQQIQKSFQENEVKPTLLFGVTGSGKTEIYLQLIEHIRLQEKSALILVPEIALTPQISKQFKDRFQEDVAVLHSALSKGERWKLWQQILVGNISIVVGARSAIFAPIQNLGLLVVDEEHDSSFKQSDHLRYHGRDLAIMRGRFTGCPVILGSATPSLESLRNVQLQRFNLVELKERIFSRPLPDVEVIDLRKQKKSDFATKSITRTLHEKLEDILNKKEQAILLYNRRGFAHFLQCTSCGETIDCPNCSVTMTVHQKDGKLRCHYCDHSTIAPKFCPQCRNTKTTELESEKLLETYGLLQEQGAGTEQVADELKELFPSARILRMDRDTTTTKDSYESILGSMRDGSADILIGTQMIAKGHDLPNVTLVGIIDADTGLHIPDFRSPEKTFQLLTQASGRAGRGTEPGRVVLQTRQPNHPAIVATVTKRFLAFARYEMEKRESLSYPPFGRIMRIVVSDVERQQAGRVSELLARMLQQKISETANPAEEKNKTKILGPSIPPIDRLRGLYRFHILIKSPSPKILSELASTIRAWGNQTTKNDTRIVIDIDPVDMM
jgi:primosomal protein N' (replication factor Y) (superfamily II helicase)